MNKKKSGGRGGKRGGAGRKPKLITVLKRAVLDRKEAEAEYALKLFVSVMRDAHLHPVWRMDAAREVMNRVWGKPNLKVEVTETPRLLVIDE